MAALGYDPVTHRIEQALPGISGSFAWSYAAGTPTACPASPGPTDFATVELNHPFSYTFLDVVPGILGFTISAPTIEAEATMRCTG